MPIPGDPCLDPDLGGLTLALISAALRDDPDVEADLLNIAEALLVPFETPEAAITWIAACLGGVFRSLGTQTDTDIPAWFQAMAIKVAAGE